MMSLNIPWNNHLLLGTCLDGASIPSNPGTVGEARSIDEDEGVGHPEALLVVQGVRGDKAGH